MMMKASTIFLVLLVPLVPLASIRGAKKPQPLEAPDEAAEATGSTVRALRGTVLPVATGTAIPAANAGAAEAQSAPVDASLASTSSMVKTIGLISSSILQQGATDAMGTTPQAAAAASRRVFEPTPLEALDAFCGRWVEDKTRRRIVGDGPGHFALGATLAQHAFDEQVWLDEDGVLCSKDATGQSMTFPLNQPSAHEDGSVYTKTGIFQHGHMITTMRKMSTDEPESVMSLQMHNSRDFTIDRWIDKNQLHLVLSLGRHTLSTILNREGLKTCSKPA